VSDIGMPGEDGYAFIRKLRNSSTRDTRTTPVIALTAFASHEDRARALAEGFNRHMSKPVDPIALVQAVLDLVALTPSRRR
jgi:CheY-like chemotaxis protein